MTKFRYYRYRNCSNCGIRVLLPDDTNLCFYCRKLMEVHKEKSVSDTGNEELTAEEQFNLDYIEHYEELNKGREQ